MSRKALTLAFFAIASLYAHAQVQPLIKFGVVSKAELEMTSYELDTSAVAVILFDYGRYTPTGAVRHMRMKIFKPAGLNYANGYGVVFKGEKFRALRASTYELVNGRVVETKLEKTSTFEEEFSETADIIKFAMPQVKVGSVIEFTYEIDPIARMTYTIGRDWRFQSDIPTMHSEFVFVRSVDAEYNKIIQGYHPVSVFEEKGTTWRWVMKDIPAFNSELLSTARNNFIATAKVRLANVSNAHFWAFLNTSWDRIGRLFINTLFFDKNVLGLNYLKDETASIIADKPKGIDKLNAIYAYLKIKTEWDGRESVVKKVTKPTSGSQTLASGQINLMLLSMLRYAGIEAYPVLISTRKHGFIRKEFPDMDQFNRMIVHAVIDGSQMLLDATDFTLPIGYLPVECLNGEGLIVVTTEHIRWIEIENFNKQRSRLTINAELTISSAGDMLGKLDVVRTGYEASAGRKAYSKKGVDNYKGVLHTQYHSNVSNSQIAGIENTSEPVKESYSIELPGHLTVSNDVMFLEPALFYHIEDEVFKSAQRVYPIEFDYAKEVVWQLTFKLPDGYKIDEIPAARTAIVPDNGGRFMYTIVPKDGAVTLISQYSLTRSLYGQDEYQDLREFHRVAASKLNEKITLRKN